MTTDLMDLKPGELYTTAHTHFCKSEKECFWHKYEELLNDESNQTDGMKSFTLGLMVGALITFVGFIVIVFL